MVQVTDKYLLTQDGLIDFDAWFKLVANYYAKDSFTVIASAIDLLMEIGVDTQSEFGNNCFQHGIEMASVLFDLQADEEVVAAALLFELYSKGRITNAEVEQKVNVQVAKILHGAKEMSVMRMLQNTDPDQAQMDKFRKMLLTLVEDVRIVLVKLAERICLVRAARNWTESYKKLIAKEILDIYAPLANRLGLSGLKWELEDRAFFYLYPVEYKKIAKKLKQKRLQREEYVSELVKRIVVNLKKNDLYADVTGRVKHIYSIWRKMNKKNLEFDSLYDIRALRILTNNVDDCYAALGVVNDMWISLPNEFADYISAPKNNGYRSVHAVFTTDEELNVEVQIRTKAMHKDSEMGVAAHWRYKEGVLHDPGYEARIVWLRSLLDWQKELAEDMDYADVESLKSQFLEERIYAFTPNGDVLDLPKGSTILDFAYHVHTMVGHRCKGAKISGKIVPLTTLLQTGDQVDILTHKTPNPSKDWCNANTGYIYSAKIRARVTRWFKLQNKEEHAQAGKERVLLEIKGLPLKSIDYEQVSKYFNKSDENSLFAAIDTGDLRFNQVINYIIENFSLSEEVTFSEPKVSLHDGETYKKNLKSNLTIYGIDNLLSHMAGCCNPVSGDDIVGYITQGRGVTVHRLSCLNFKKLHNKYPERVIEVTWGNKDSECYLADLLVTGYTSDKFASEVFSLLAIDKVKIISSKTTEKESKNIIIVQIRIAVDHIDMLDGIIQKLNVLPGVKIVQRL